MKKGFLSPGGMKKPAAASSKRNEDDETLARRKAREAEEAMQAWARDLTATGIEQRVRTLVRCDFVRLEAGGQGIRKQAYFSWTLLRPSDKRNVFGHEQAQVEPDPVRVDNLRRPAVSVPGVEDVQMQLRWELFLEVAADAAGRAAQRFDFPIACEYAGAAVHHGRAGGPTTYEQDPAKWPASALGDGRATHAHIYFRFIADLSDGRRGEFLKFIRVDDLMCRQLALPSQDELCEATVVRRQPYLESGGQRQDVYINAKHVAEYDDAYLQFKASSEEQQLSKEQRQREFHKLVREYGADGAEHSWAQVADWVQENNLQVRFLMASDHERLCTLHKKIFDVEHSVGRAEASADPPLRVLWAVLLSSTADSGAAEVEDVEKRPRSLLLRRAHPLNPALASTEAPGNWTWYSSFSDFLKHHVNVSTGSSQGHKLHLCKELEWKDLEAFGYFLGLQGGFDEHYPWRTPFPYTRYKVMPAFNWDELKSPDRPKREPMLLQDLCAKVLAETDRHPEWPSLRTFCGMSPDAPFKLHAQHDELRCSVLSEQFKEQLREGWRLLLAADKGDEAEIQTIVAKRAYLDAVDDRGWTALHLAASRGHAEVARILCDAGASCNIRMAGGYTPLSAAAGGVVPGDLETLLNLMEVIEVLMSAKADPAVIATSDSLEALKAHAKQQRKSEDELHDRTCKWFQMVGAEEARFLSQDEHDWLKAMHMALFGRFRRDGSIPEKSETHWSPSYLGFGKVMWVLCLDKLVKNGEPTADEQGLHLGGPVRPSLLVKHRYSSVWTWHKSYEHLDVKDMRPAQ